VDGLRRLVQKRSSGDKAKHRGEVGATADGKKPRDEGQRLMNYGSVH
jgi:hypothetical protein